MSPSVPSAADAYTALSSYQAPSATSVLSQADSQAGLPAAQQRVSDLTSTVGNLKSSLDAVDPSVTGRTSGTFTTEGQRQALVTKEQAPIQTNLTDENGNLSTAQNAETTANGNASSIASAIMGQNQQQYQQLLDQYNAASAEEKQAESVREYNATLAEQQSEAAATAKAAAATTNYLPTRGTTPTAASAPQAFSSFKNGKDGSGGTNFTDSGGAAISAAKYAQLTGQNVATVIQKLGASGDKYAQQAYNEIANNQAYYAANPNVLKSEFSSLFWGS